MYVSHLDLTAFGELEIGTVVPPLLLPAAPRAENIVPTGTNVEVNDKLPSTLIEPHHRNPEPRQELVDQNTHSDAMEPEEPIEKDRIESDPLQDEFTTISTVTIPSVTHKTAVSTTKKRSNFRAALKGKHSISSHASRNTSTTTTTTGAPS
jgi:hypothetical protein